VIKPLIDAVEYEIPLLGRGSLDWRFYTRMSEFIRPVVGYVGESRLDLEDLLRAREAMADPLVVHDDLLRTAVDCAGKAYDALVAQAPFVTLVTEKLAEYYATHDRALQRPGGAFEDDKLPQLMAQRVVNNDGTAGHPETDANFWNANRQAFLAFGIGPAFDALRVSVEAMHAHDLDLLRRLKELHFDLVETFDIDPGAQFPGVTSVALVPSQVEGGRETVPTITLDDIHIQPKHDVDRATVQKLIEAIVLTVIFFVVGYAGSIIFVIGTGKEVPSGYFVAATLAWFAFCALLCGVLARVAFAVVTEMRVANSREYVWHLTKAYVRIGVDKSTLVRLGELAVYPEIATSGSVTSEMQTLTPLVQIARTATETGAMLAEKIGAK
jgi:hypothetical protein